MANIRQNSNKFKKIQRIAEKRALNEKKMSGVGKFVFKNRNEQATLTLPKKGLNGETTISPGGTFEGDDYFMFMVPKELLIVKALDTINETKETEVINEEKLILDQPDVVTGKGKVEHVVEDEPQSLKEDSINEDEPKLLTEDPLAGITIITD